MMRESAAETRASSPPPPQKSARLNPTVAALLRRGFDTNLANKIRRLKLTLGDLQQRDDETLAFLGLEPHHISAVRDGGRPDIPFETLVEVLWANRSSCCVCRSFDRAIILHHITPWAISRDHSASNLAVLCLEHHAHAHRTGTLEQNLGERQLRAFKARWEAEVLLMDSRVILDATRADDHHWWWFNHVRLLGIARSLEIDLTTICGFASAHHRGWIDEQGQLTSEHLRAPYLYVGGNGIILYGYMRRVAETVFADSAIFNLGGDPDPEIVSRLLRPGDLVLVAGEHQFTSLTQIREGPGQSCEVRCQSGRVETRFAADRWEAVSNSSWSAWLYGRNLAASVVRLVDIERHEGALRLKATGLAIGSQLQGLSTSHFHGLALQTVEPDG